MSVTVTEAHVDDAPAVAAVAAATFPLACPDSVAAEDVAAFISEHLSEQCFTGYLRDPDRVVFTARAQGRIVGYAMLIRGADGVELSKMYVQPDHHGTGAAGALMRAGITWAAGTGAPGVWLGVNQNNVRAQRFYGKHGFQVTGTRTFRLGEATETDFVMRRPL